jgi:hypothetical protein
LPESQDRIVGEPLEPLIFAMREQRIILDYDLARVYGVPTRALNQAVKRNADRFPADFAFQLTVTELADLKSQSVISSSDVNQGVPEDRSQIVTSSHGGMRKRPWAFSEHGALMAANVLRTPLAIQMSIFVIRAFVRLREHVAANAAILKRLAEIDRSLLQHDAALRDVYRKLQPLLAPPPETPKRRIGF